MGGKTAMQFALQYPESVNRLIIADMAPKTYPAKQKSIVETLLALDLSNFNTRKEIESVLAPSIPELKIRQFLLKDLKKDSQGSFAWQMNLRAILDHYDLLTQAIAADKPFDKPTLFLKGENSRYILPEDAEIIHRLFPRAVIQTIPAAGHWVHVEAPEVFIRIVKDFLLLPKTAG
jgi:pimeloyl-ACP methyl ester carboxylesterase